ncbi:MULTISPECIES: Zn-dependent hydrolase [Brevibacterium]|uniref:Zn-dependent hydrolase n=2 Tax=Brevibacterium TaxID=1696 RepID=A0A2A3ZTT9_BREAU|nr:MULTISPECIES: Zn-dependent hydrolase [Brevibacterium]PCC55090.1 Zn-dependent hydrolase [Brevibacterium aurantiacum]SMX85355.1 allantoate deiminase [Brevibacterium antiquum]
MTTITEASLASQTTTETLVDELLNRFARLTETGHGPGVTRLAYTRLEREAHEVFTEFMTDLGLTVWTDQAGNTIAELAGRRPGPAIGTGSHLDSVPNAGAYDGIAGVIAAMVAAWQLAEQETFDHPLRFVAFAAEEGARFGQACTGSRLAAGLTESADLDHLHDAAGTSMADAFREVGLDPEAADEARWSADDWAGFVELHIEQGSVLTDTNTQIGVVDTISGSTRLHVEFRGRASHTGGTPMHLRADALAAAAELITAGETLATDPRHRGTRITVGTIEVEPGSMTTIPGLCRLDVDIRDTDDRRQRETALELIGRAERLAAERGVDSDVQVVADASPAILPLSIQRQLTSAAHEVGCSYRVMPSGASHDTQMISHVCPVGMLFVPSQNHGISHAPEELTHTTDIVRGIDVLIAGLRRLDSAI